MPGVAGAELVYVTIASADPEATETVVALRVLPDGITVVPAFLDRDRLVEVCGEQQPWMLIPVERLADLQGELGFEQILLDEGGCDGRR
ncbi:MAG: SAV_915 family protein [Pseudonocardiaceae bacterium]